jgi:hypothetical protein
MISSCTPGPEKKSTAQQPGNSISLKGTWKLVSATKVSKGLTTFTDFTRNQEMIKIINDTHFAFVRHDLKPDAEGKNNFDAGGGRYQLAGNQYTEHLDYYKDKNWEGKAFTFTVTIRKDTLIQTGIEKIESEGIDQTITEKYLKVR